jgi:stalled ribosome rescue protein Dom34
METVMSREAGVWIDHHKAVIVNISGDEVSSTTLSSDVAPHPRYAGSQEGGGEKKYEERHQHDLDRYYDQVISRVGEADALLVIGPGEAKRELKERLGRSSLRLKKTVAVESADKMTEPQIVARVKEHYQVAR